MSRKTLGRHRHNKITEISKVTWQESEIREEMKTPLHSYLAAYLPEYSTIQCACFWNVPRAYATRCICQPVFCSLSVSYGFSFFLRHFCTFHELSVFLVTSVTTFPPHRCEHRSQYNLHGGQRLSTPNSPSSFNLNCTVLQRQTT